MRNDAFAFVSETGYCKRSPDMPSLCLRRFALRSACVTVLGYRTIDRRCQICARYSSASPSAAETFSGPSIAN